jgi:DNA primase
MSSPVEQIKDKLGIVDVVGSYITLEKAGLNFKAKCPFHNEKTASFYVSPTRNSYYCFGCGEKGDIFSFIQRFEGLDFVGALRVLAKQAGVELVKENPTIRTERERLYLIMEHATLFFQKQLGNNVKARDYLKKRGVNAETARTWRLGYAPVEWRTLAQYLVGKKFTLQDIEKVGLIKQSERDNKSEAGHYDRFRGRIMFPIFDSSGRTVAFSGRQFESDGTEAKYLNSPETVLFEKSKILYGYNKAKLDIRRKNFALLVEGQMDLIMAHQAGFTNAIATSGTALTTHQLEIIKRLSPNLVIAYDGDAAGNAAAARGWQLALVAGMEVKIAVLPEGKDPADLAHDNPKELEESIQNAKHIIEILLARVIKTVPDKREQGRAIEKQILPYIADLDSAIEQSYFISAIANATNIKEDVLRQEVRKVADKSHRSTSSVQPEIKAANPTRRQTIERMLWGTLYWLERNNQQSTINSLDVKEKISKIVGKEKLPDIQKHMDGIADELIFEIEFLLERNSDLNRLIDELVTNLDEDYTREQLASAMLRLQQAERRKDTAEVSALLKTCHILSERLRSMKKEAIK